MSYRKNMQFSVEEMSIGNVKMVQAVDMIHSLSRHMHRTLSICAIERGARECSSKGARYVIGEGQILILNPGQIHTCTAADGIPYSYYTLCINMDVFLHEVKGSTGRPIPYFKDMVIDDKIFFNRFMQLCNVLKQPVPQLEKESLYISTVMSFISRYGGGIEQEKLRRENQAVKLVCDYLEANLVANVSLNELSKLVNFSPYYLTRIFTQNIGLPPHEFHNLLRIKQAQKLLAKKAPLIEVAVATGFVDQSHFSRCFKKVVGMTPRQYRCAYGG